MQEFSMKLMQEFSMNLIEEFSTTSGNSMEPLTKMILGYLQEDIVECSEF